MDRMGDQVVLAMLADSDGAVLGWKVPNDKCDAFASAFARGVIRFDDDTDCYVHPEARREGDGYTMRLGGGNVQDVPA